MTRHHSLDELDTSPQWQKRRGILGLNDIRQPFGSPEHCHCGQLLGHDWPGKDQGQPHPRPAP
jgi:hypothetical protein